MSLKLNKHEASDDDQITTLKKEIKEIHKSLKDISQFVKNIEETFLKAKETPKEKVEEIHECCFDTKDAVGNNEETIYVFGFRCSRSREVTRSILKKHFDPCGEVTRVFVPTNCRTGAPIGFAFIDLKEDPKKALSLDGSYLEGLKIQVSMAVDREEYYAFPGVVGCKRCFGAAAKRANDLFVKTGGGLYARWNSSGSETFPSRK